MAIAQVCGAECGLPSGNTNGTARDRHWNAAVGTTLPIADTAIKRTGNRSFKFVTGATKPYIPRVGVAATNTVVGARFYVYFDTITADTHVLHILPAAGTTVAVQVTSAGVIQAGPSSGGGWLSGGTMVADTWNGIEIQVDLRANPNVIYLRTDVGDTGTWTDHGTVNLAQAATTQTQFRFGTINATAADTVWIDDIVCTEGTTLNEHYPLGSGYVKAYKTNASSVVLNATGDLKYNNTTNITAGATDLHTYVDDVDGSSFMDMDAGITDYISQNVADGTDDVWTRYGQYQFEDSAESVPPRFVNLLTVFHSASTTANELNTRASDDGTNWTAIWGSWTAGTNVGLDVSETSAIYLAKVMATKPSGGAWDDTAFDALRVQVGHSNDISPVPFLDFIGVEAEFVPSAGTNAPAEAATGTGAAANSSTSVKPTGGAATATGAANNAVPSVKPNAAAATGTGTANNATTLLASNASPGVATGTGAAANVAAKVAPNAGTGTGTGAALDATVSVATATNAAAVTATGTGAASNVSASVKPAAAQAAGTGLANNPAASVKPNAATATGTGAALDATASTASTASAAAGVATGTGAASNVTTLISASAITATGAGTASGALGSDQASAIIATGTGTAYDAAAETVSTKDVEPETAAGTGAATDASVAIEVNAGVATGTGAAIDAFALVPGATIASAGVATGSGSAHNAFITVQEAGAPGGQAGSYYAARPRGVTKREPTPKIKPKPALVFAYAQTARGKGTAFNAKTEWNDDETALSLLLDLEAA